MAGLKVRRNRTLYGSNRLSGRGLKNGRESSPGMCLKDESVYLRLIGYA